ncbi:phytoene/squalene synthase family protein [Gordonia sinesedis]
MSRNRKRSPSAEPPATRGYRRARAISARHGRTYHLATRMLPAARRDAVFALYGFARVVDDVVDDVDLSRPEAAKDAAVRLDAIEGALDAALRSAGRAEDVLAGPDPTGSSSRSGARSEDAELDELLAALADTVTRFGVDPDTFGAFLASMRMDVPGTPGFRSRYRTFDELAEYTYGSAAVIGLQVLPVLGADPTAEHLRGPAIALGEAFQLTNFVRDVAEDLARDRIYLPTDELSAFGVDEDRLRRCAATGVTDAPLRRALAHVIAVNRDLYRAAAPGITLLPRSSRPAIAAAAAGYEEILTVIEDSGYQVMAGRAVVPTRRRAARAVRAVFSSRADTPAVRTPGPAPAG